MLSEAYVGFRREEGKIIQDVEREEKKMGPACISEFCRKSKKRLCNKITEEQRSDIFHTFCKKTSWDQRKMFIVNMVEQKTVKERKTESAQSRRNASLSYYLKIENDKKQVCKNMFLNTLGVHQILDKQPKFPKWHGGIF